MINVYCETTGLSTKPFTDECLAVSSVMCNLQNSQMMSQCPLHFLDPQRQRELYSLAFYKTHNLAICQV